MSGRGLLSRLASGGEPADEVESIIAHLQVLLNARQGDAPSALTFGVVDFSDMVHAFPGAVQQLSRSIRETILGYEPRLKNVTVRPVPGEELLLRFEISAQLTNQRAGRTLRFATTVRPGGRFDVAG